MGSKYINLRNFLQESYTTTFLLGARGVGKTVNAFLTMIDEFKATGRKGVYLRRYDTEIETASINFKLIGQLSESEITRDYVELDGVRTDVILVDDEPAIYMCSLSTAGKYKSKSFDNVWIVIYDEFLDLYDRELKQETKIFTNLMQTIFRDYWKYNALFLANATNLFNCYFLDWEIMPNGRVTKYKDLGIKIVMYRTSDELNNERNSSPLAKLVAKTEGEGGSSLENKFSGSFTNFIKKLSKEARYKATLKLNDEIYGLYKDGRDDIITPKADDNFKKKYAMTYQDVEEEYPLIDWEAYSALRYRFLKTHVFFTDVKTRSKFMRKFKKNSLYSD